MKISVVLIALTIVANNCLAKTLRSDSDVITVAVIDTGIDLSLIDKNIMCKYGHKDFTSRDPRVPYVPLQDLHGHGTHISGLIDQYAKGIFLSQYNDNNINNINKLFKTKIKYCQVILKYYDQRATGQQNLDATIEAIKWATKLKVDYINLSGGGPGFNLKESEAVKAALALGIKLVVAAGNEGRELGKDYFDPAYNKTFNATYYPAMYSNKIIVVGNIEKSGKRAPSSNYGHYVTTWEYGVDTTSIVPRYGTITTGSMTGTSQATAIKTGKLIRKQLEE